MRAVHGSATTLHKQSDGGKLLLDCRGDTDARDDDTDPAGSPHSHPATWPAPRARAVGAVGVGDLCSTRLLSWPALVLPQIA